MWYQNCRAEALQLVLLAALHGSSGHSSHSGVAWELLDWQTRMEVSGSVQPLPQIRILSCHKVS